ncbi:MAG TPA: hypothetical protein VHZ09_16240 [Acidobacteriaceae bacterium]|jgi:hypothetical protein|nr:hypothetical protein [Acidobacteriaceae bacterium]
MLRLVEFGLLAVAIAVVLGLVVRGKVEAPPEEAHPLGARETPEEKQHRVG